MIEEKLSQEVSDLRTAHGLVTGFSSVARGADCLFLNVLANNKIPYQVVLPFPRQEFSQDFEPEQWATSEQLIDQAYEVLVVPSMPTRRDAYLEGGVILVDRCDLLIAVWNGEEAAGKGGTGQIVGYARSRGLPLIIIDAVTGDVFRERLDKIAQPDQSILVVTQQLSDPVPNQLRQRVQTAYDTFDRNASDHGPWARPCVST